MNRLAAPAADRARRLLALPVDERPGGRRRVVLSLALVTVVVEILTYADVLPRFTIGDFQISASLVPGLLLTAACGGRLFGRSGTRKAAWTFWIVAAIMTSGITVAYARLDRALDVPALLLAAFDEELVYRLAVPAIIALALRRLDVADDRARVSSLALAGLWFVLLPGHREQMTSPALAIPFIAFAALSAIIVYRSGSIVPMALAHATSNLLAILVWNDAVPDDARPAGLAVVMAMLVLAYGRRRPVVHDDHGGLLDIRTGLRPAVIDLRDGVTPIADGHILSSSTAGGAGG